MKLKRNFLVATVGHPGSGKDKVSERISQSFGVKFASSSDYLRNFMTARELGELDPENMNKMSTQLRRDLGADFLVKKILSEYSVPQLVIGGLRLVSEVETTKRNGGIIIAVTAPQRMRYERRKERRRLGDNMTFEEFVAFEELESQSVDPLKHNVNAVMAMADHRLPNEGTLEELYKATDTFMLQLFA